MDNFKNVEIKNDNNEIAKTKSLKNKNTRLMILALVLGVALVAFVVLYSLSMSKQTELKIDLENIYQKNFNELVDNVNNSEIKLSKVLASDYNSYAKKMLNEISKNTSMASNNLSSLPVSINGIDETIKFINQVSGYTQSLANKMEKGESLSNEDIKTLTELKYAFDDLKNNINKLSKDIYRGNIYSESNKLDGDYNNFTIKLQNVKAGDVDYPTMIYDGPFSDSTLNKEIKKKKKTVVSKEIVLEKLQNIFKNVASSNFEFLGETNGKFKTYDYELLTSDNNSIYVQVTQNGAELLTMSCADGNNQENYTIDEAKEIAKNFTKLAGVDMMECVWSDIVSGDAYINLAPVKDNIILYPDLIKVKVDLNTGNVVGYEASSYFTNHTTRQLEKAQISKEVAESKVPKMYQRKETRLVLAPLDYNREMLCYETTCTKDGDTYYIYVNAISGLVENILKTVETDNGNLLL